MEQLNLYIDGKYVPSESGRTYQTLDPYTGQAWAQAADATTRDVDRAVTAARTALTGPWGTLTPPERGELLRALAQLITRNADKLAELEVRDGGKLLREMSDQAKSLPAWYTYYAGLADKLAGEVIPTNKPNYLVYTRHEPVGVVAAITPWNSPLLLLTWKLAPALAAGCTIVVKPSDYTPASTLALAELLAEAGFPPGVFNVITGWGPETGKALTAHPGIDRIAFTGSTDTGKAVARAAADNITRVSLELGGKSAQIVFADADLDAATNGLIAGVFAATGQTCMAGSRLLAQDTIADTLVEKIVQRANQIVLGDPAHPTPKWAHCPTTASWTQSSTTSGPPANRAPPSPAAANPSPNWAATSSAPPY
jgi:aldehyde dehydrogenase (NAD+)